MAVDESRVRVRVRVNLGQLIRSESIDNVPEETAGEERVTVRARVGRSVRVRGREPSPGTSTGLGVGMGMGMRA